MQEYEPPAAARAVIVGSPVLLVLLVVGVAACVGGDSDAIAVVVSLFVATVCVIVFFAMMAAFRESLVRSASLDAPLGKVTPLPPSAEGLESMEMRRKPSPEGCHMHSRGYTPDAWLSALTQTQSPLTDEEFAAAVREYFPELRSENA